MRHENRTNKRIYLGIFLIAIGFIWILERLGLVSDAVNDILISWQMLLIGIGLFSMIGGNKTTGSILIVIGGFFLLPALYPEELYEFRKFIWPVLLVAIGVILLFRSRHKDEPAFQEGSQNMDYFDDFVIFGGREIFINSQNFLGGKTTAIFGGTEYDMRRTNLSENGAVVDCVSIFGGCTFKVPPDWNVKNDVVTIFGAFTDKRGSTFHDNQTNGSKTIIIKGFSAFGGVEVKLV